MKISKRKLVWIAAGLVVLVLVVLAFLPDPVPVETVEVTRGAMRVTIDDDGKTRVIDRYTIAAPAAGRLARIELREGAPIAAGDVVARIDAAPLEPARREELQALLDAAEAARAEAVASAARAESSWELARSDLRRNEQLAEEGVISSAALDQLRSAEETARRELAASRARVRTAESNVEAARARLLSTSGAGERAAIEVRAPAAGRVLRIPDRSSRVVQPGEPILEVGNANRIELVVDVLSEDAVRMSVGDAVIVEEWGGDEPLRGAVRVIEPSAFTKISALGIEEQRVNVIAGIDGAPPQLGDAYRVEASIVIWESDDVVRLPVSALGRVGDAWSVFVVNEGRARQRAVRIGHRNPEVAEVLEGVEAGERVIVHPGADVEDGVRVAMDR